MPTLQRGGRKMRSALYYPHTKFHTENILKRSLLLWDKLEYIVAHESYKPTYQDNGRQPHQRAIRDEGNVAEDGEDAQTAQVVDRAGRFANRRVHRSGICGSGR